MVKPLEELSDAEVQSFLEIISEDLQYTEDDNWYEYTWDKAEHPAYYPIEVVEEADRRRLRR